MTKSEPVVTERVSRQGRPIKHRSGSFLFIAFALTALVGYLVGTFNSQIMAAIGPVFGYKSHAATLDLSSLQTVYSNLAANFDGTLDPNVLIDGAKHGLVSAAGDTYTLYMNQKEANDFNNDLSGNIGAGIGAALELQNNAIVVQSVLPGNPAVKAGMQAGDIITAVNDQSTSGWTVDQVVSKVRGDAGTTVKVTIQRDGTIMNFNITRATINNPSVTSAVANGIGTITISRFDDQTGTLARAAAQDFKSKNVKAVILDLRNDGGGYLTAAQDVAGLWLDNQVVVTERSGGAVIDTLRTGSNVLLAGIPTVVLVNGSSASASEIVAGALQDYGAAKLVGEKTFGKGSVQKLIDLDGGAQLKVTIAKWYTPKGKNINKEGITPDVSATLTQADVDAGRDPQVIAAQKALGL